MHYSSLVGRISGESAEVWEIHYEARKRLERGEDIIILSVGEESGETTPDEIQEAAIASIRGGRHHYTPVLGEGRLREAIAQRHRERTGQRVGKANVAVFSGTQNALFAVCLCLLEHGDEVIVPELYYATYPATVTAGGAKLVPIPTRAEHGFQPDSDSFAAAVTSKTRAVLLNSPNNPTGAIYSREMLNGIKELCRKRDIWIISDEVYAEIAPEGFVSVAGLPGSGEHTVTISSLSKTHRMTGWRCGWMVGPETLTGYLSNLNMCMTYGLPPFIQDAAVAALESDRETAGKVRMRLERNRAVFREELSEMPGAGLFAGGGGMFAVLDVRQLDVSSRDFAGGLLENEGVSVLPCDGFGTSGRGLVRVSLCESEDVTREAAQRILRHLESLEKHGRLFGSG